MAKYKVIYRNDSPSWQEGCPLQISTIQVSRNTETGTCYLQARIANISAEPIQSVEIEFAVTDTDGTRETHLVQLLDADIPAGEDMAPKALKLDMHEIALVEASVLRVDKVTSFGEAFEIPQSNVPKLSKEASEERAVVLLGHDVLPDVCPGTLSDHGSWWQCGCGAANVGRSTCHVCGLEKELGELIDSPEQLAAHARERKYLNAKELVESDDIDKIRKGEAALIELGDYSDAAQAAQTAQQRALQLEEASAKRRKKTKRACIAAAAAAAALLLVWNFVIPAVAPPIKYEIAKAQLNGGNYEQAYDTFKELDGFSDSNKLKQTAGKKVVPDLASVKKKDIVRFGVYEQDGNNKNGKELISWRVLKVEKNRVLLISQKVLDSLTYSEASHTAKFEASAFSKQVQTSFDGSPFLLDADELDEFFSSDSARKARATKYVQEKVPTSYIESTVLHQEPDWIWRNSQYKKTVRYRKGTEKFSYSSYSTKAWRYWTNDMVECELGTYCGVVYQLGSISADLGSDLGEYYDPYAEFGFRPAIWVKR